MDALATAFDAVVPAFLVIAAGALADRLLPRLDLTTLARLAVQLLIPALVFDALVDTDLTLGGASLLGAGYLLYLAGLGAVAWLGTRGLGADAARAVVVAALFGNTGNMGLPITLFAYGEAGLERAVVLLVVSLALMFAVAPAVLAGGVSGLRARLLAALRLPPLWVTPAAFAFNLLGWELPLSLERGVGLLSDATIPVMLLALGIQMRRSWTWSLSGSALRATLLRLGVGPFVAWGAAAALGLAPLDRDVLVLSAAMPTAVTLFVVAIEVDGDAPSVARTVVATTVGSLVAITLVLFVFPGV